MRDIVTGLDDLELLALVFRGYVEVDRCGNAFLQSPSPSELGEVRCGSQYGRLWHRGLVEPARWRESDDARGKASLTKAGRAVLDG